VLPHLWGRACDVANYRHALQLFDARYGGLADAEIDAAFTAIWKRNPSRAGVSVTEATRAQLHGWFSAIARLTLSVGAFDVSRSNGESEKSAVARVGNTFRTEFDQHQRKKPKPKTPRTR
jgi:hypothetical protein